MNICVFIIRIQYEAYHSSQIDYSNHEAWYTKIPQTQYGGWGSPQHSFLIKVKDPIEAIEPKKLISLKNEGIPNS